MDTGPLVALVSGDDSRHNDCTTALNLIAPPLITTWPVLTEAAWILRAHPVAIQQILVWVSSGFLTVRPIGDEAAPWIAKYFRKYRQIGPQLADSSLVYLAEREDLDTVFTLDRRDFSVYRFSRNRRFHLLPD